LPALIGLPVYLSILPHIVLLPLPNNLNTGEYFYRCIGLYSIQSIHVGDIIEVEGKVGRVFEIRLRSTRALTRDDKVLIIPNHIFLTNTIYNYTQNHNTTRESLVVGVAYGSDVQLVTNILEEIAMDQTGVLKDPPPFVQFDDFGDSALVFSLNFFIEDGFRVPRMRSEMRYKIDDQFRKKGVTIPFPQRDVHFFQHGPIALKKD